MANTVWFFLDEISRAVKIMGTENRMVVARDRGRGNGELVFRGHRVSILQARKF